METKYRIIELEGKSTYVDQKGKEVNATFKFKSNGEMKFENGECWLRVVADFKLPKTLNTDVVNIID